MPQQILKLVVKGHLNTVETRNVFYYGQDSTGPDFATVGTAVNQIVKEAYEDVAEMLTSSIVFYEAESYKLIEENWVPVGVYTWNVPGLVAGDFSSFQTSVLISAATQVFRAVGRKFLPGVTEQYTTEGAIASTAVDILLAFGTFYTSAIPVFGNGTWYPGVPSVHSLFAPFVDFSVGTILSTIRRRKPGYGI